MTLPLFLVEPDRLAGTAAGSHVVLDGAEGRHAAVVRRVRVGEELMLGDGHGRRVVGTVAAAGSAELEVVLCEVLDEPEPSPRFVLVQALAKGARDEQAIETATELGVDEVLPWQAARSIVIWRGERATRSLGRWQTVVSAAAKQSRRSRVPVVSQAVGQRALLERVQASALTLVLHEQATTALAGHGIPDRGDVLLVVGPEGGIAPEELRALEDAGGIAVRLGDGVLRSSSAGPAALAVLSAASRWR